MYKIIIFSILSIAFINISVNSQDIPVNIFKNIGIDKKDHGLSESEVIEGLRAALEKGVSESVRIASSKDGFYGNPMVFIPFPPEAEQMKTTLEATGFSTEIGNFEKSLNRAAEDASRSAASVFMKSISQMTVSDGFEILNGSDTAATTYLKTNSEAELRSSFKPIIEKSIESENVTKYWSDLVMAYNKIPFVKKQNPDLVEYVNHRAIEGLFKLIAREEQNIRSNPGARTSEILQRVFGKN